MSHNHYSPKLCKKRVLAHAEYTVYSVNGIAFRDGKPHKQVPADIYLEQYVRLPDPQGPVEVWLVDGNLVRSYYKTDYTEGGHGYVYPWVPRPQIWIEDGVDRREVPFIVS